MKGALALGAAVVLAANAVALVNAARNRWGQPESTLEVTESEAPLAWRGRENSGLFVQLQWRQGMRNWTADPKSLAEFGFAGGSGDGGRRPLARPGYVAIEAREPQATAAARPQPQLTVVDGSRDAARLRARHPDRARTLILRATFRARYDAAARAWRGASVNLLNSSLAVPDRYRPLLENLQPQYAPAAPRYTITLAAGANYEPYIASVRMISRPSPSAAPAP